jgi:predicted PurR-regulated permease PerM
MEHLLLAGVVGVFIGVLLSVFFIALLAAADRDRLPEPSPVRTHAVSAS